MKSRLITLLCILIILPVGWMLVVKLESEVPSIRLALSQPFIGKKQSIPVEVFDSKSGIRSVWIGLLQSGKEVVLLRKEFPGEVFIGGGKEKQATFNIEIEPKEMGMNDGKAMLRMVVRDFSWRKWWSGNRAYLEKEVTIDTTSPQIDFLSRAHNVSQGGSGLVIYRLSESCPTSGVYVGEKFFPGHTGNFKDTNIVVSFFALAYNQEPVVKIYVEATDFSGNNSRAGFPYYLKKKTFNKALLEISDKFLNWKMPEFDDVVEYDSHLSNSDKFLKINHELRLANHRKIVEVVRHTDKKLYWNGAFMRLPKSERKAGYAEHRRYKYKGRIIDRQVHLGIDLASVAHSPIPAANNGKVAFRGNLGIYGNTVIIDHGFGLFSSYSHLSGIDVTVGKVVSKGDIIGRSGSTGLAGGDHLHFGMLVHDTFVNPVEWWDASWIKNNISTKIDSVRSYEN